MAIKISIASQNSLVAHFTNTGDVGKWLGWHDEELREEFFRVIPEFKISAILYENCYVELGNYMALSAIKKLNHFDPVEYQIFGATR